MTFTFRMVLLAIAVLCAAAVMFKVYWLAAYWALLVLVHATDQIVGAIKGANNG